MQEASWEVTKDDQHVCAKAQVVGCGFVEWLKLRLMIYLWSGNRDNYAASLIFFIANPVTGKNQETL